MKFRREAKAKGFFLEEGVESVQFDVPGERRSAVVVLPTEKGSKSPHDLGVLLRAEVEFEPTETIVDAFASLESGRLPDDTPPREDWPRDFSYINEDGKVKNGHTIPEPILSKKFQNFLDSVHDELAQATHNVFGVLRWRMAMEGPHSPSLRGGTTWWAEGRQQWLPFPSSTSTTLSAHRIPPLRPDFQADVQQMLDAHHQEAPSACTTTRGPGTANHEPSQRDPRWLVSA